MKRLRWFKREFTKWWKSESETIQLILVLLISTVFILTLIVSIWLIPFGFVWIGFFVWLRYESKAEEELERDIWRSEERPEDIWVVEERRPYCTSINYPHTGAK